NYERENDLNLWFVATARDSGRLDALLAGIGSATGLEVLALPLVEEYHIDLGFDLRQHGGDKPLPPPASDAIRLRPTGAERKLLEALQDGIEIIARPYAALAGRCGMSEAEVLATLARWQQTGVVRRFGVIVRHHELGYIANAMVVWDVADAAAAALGRQLALKPDVTLCYLRARALPRWRFNLYCMVHGKDRDQVLARVGELSRECGLEEFERNILFSRRRFKQTGARYANTEMIAEGAEHGRA
ncbi:MAG: Lrp/AsnC family transcriptional regulator, partial [Burkholderiales bacterium]